MRYWYQSPNEQLSDLVQTVLIVDRLAEEGHPKVPLVIAGMPAVMFELAMEKTNPKDVLITLYGSPVPSDCQFSADHPVTILYFFKPFSMPALFSIEASRIARGPVAADWRKPLYRILKDQLLSARAPLSIITTLDNFFLKQLQRQRPVCEAIKFATDEIMIHPDADTLSQLPGRLHITQRTFQRLFRKYVGVSATEYRRICQFRQSFQQVRSRRFDKLSDVAMDNGFADQSHFVRSFREFSDVTPGQYLDHGLNPK